MAHVIGTILPPYGSVDYCIKKGDAFFYSSPTTNANICFAGVLTKLHPLNFNASFFKLSSYKYLFVTFIDYYYTYFWRRLSFRGKSYRVRLYRRFQKFSLNFGYSHQTKLQLSSCWGFLRRKKRKEKQRQKYIVFTNVGTILQPFVMFFPRIRYFNCYTMRGLRLVQQPIIRRFGKLSQHISSLH